MCITAQLEDRQYQFLLDTGAQVSCISKKLIDNRSTQSIQVGGAAGHQSEMAIICMKALETLGVKINNLPMLVLREDQLAIRLLGKTLMSIDGIIGWDILKHMDFEVNLENRLLVTRPQKVDSVYNMPKSDFPIVILEDESNQLLRFGIDLGAKKSWISKSLINKCNLSKKSNKAKLIYGVNGFVKQETTIVKKVVLWLVDHEIVIKDISTGFTGLINDVELDGVLGIDICKEKVIYFHNSEGFLKLMNINRSLEGDKS